ncbi:hypothetical protein CspHIS471_0507380 [Cutaneotrichosporon sp. HIS471]|nr:hypothetical protein CspHIS471_0507380 [Cutaneotrichosporon sp. HIS471]
MPHHRTAAASHLTSSLQRRRRNDPAFDTPSPDAISQPPQTTSFPAIVLSDAKPLGQHTFFATPSDGPGSGDLPAHQTATRP